MSGASRFAPVIGIFLLVGSLDGARVRKKAAKQQEGSKIQRSGEDDWSALAPSFARKYGNVTGRFDVDMFTSQTDRLVSDNECKWDSKGEQCMNTVTESPDQCEYGMRKRGAERSWWKPSLLSTRCYGSSAKDACCLAKRANRPDGVVSAEFVMATTKVLQQTLQLNETTTGFLINRRLLKLVKSIQVLLQMGDNSDKQHVLGATTELFLSEKTSLSLWMSFAVDQVFWKQVLAHHNNQFPDHQVEAEVLESFLATSRGIQEKLNKEHLHNIDVPPMAWVAAIIGKATKKSMDNVNMSPEHRRQILAKLEDVKGETSSSGSGSGSPTDDKKVLEDIAEETETAEEALDEMEDAAVDDNLEVAKSSLVEMDPYTKMMWLEGGLGAMVIIGHAITAFFTAIFNMIKFIVLLPYHLFQAVVIYWVLRQL